MSASGSDVRSQLTEAALDGTLQRIVFADDKKLPVIAEKMLPWLLQTMPLLPSAGAVRKHADILRQVISRIKSHPDVALPVEAILSLLLKRGGKSHAGQLGTSLVFLSLGLPRCSPARQQRLVPPLLLAPFSAQPQQRPMLLRMLTQILAGVDLPVDHEKRRQLIRFVGNWADRTSVATPGEMAVGPSERRASDISPQLASLAKEGQEETVLAALEDAQAAVRALPSTWNSPVFEAPEEWCANAVTFASWAADYVLLQRQAAPAAQGTTASSGAGGPAAPARISPGLSYAALWRVAGGDQKSGAKPLPPAADLTRRKVALLRVAGSRSLPDGLGLCVAVAALGDGTDAVRQEARSVLERCGGSAPTEHVDFEAAQPDRSTVRMAAAGLPPAETERLALAGEGYRTFCEPIATEAGSGGGLSSSPSHSSSAKAASSGAGSSAAMDDGEGEVLQQSVTDPRAVMLRFRCSAFVLRRLFAIVLGSGAKGTPQHLRRLPGPEPSRIEALKILARSRTAAHVMPDATLVMTQCFLSKKAPLRVRRAAAPFVSSFLRRAPAAVLKRLAPILLAGLVSAIRSLQDDAVGGSSPATGDFAHSASSLAAGDSHGREAIRQGIDRNEREKVREASYSQVVLLAARAPAAVASSGSTAAFLVEMAQREPSHMRLSVSAALSRCMLAYAEAAREAGGSGGSARGLLDSLRKTVETASRSADARLRLVAAQWCGSVLEPIDVSAKLLCVELAGDPAREVRVEAYRGLVPGERVLYSGMQGAAQQDGDDQGGAGSGDASAGRSPASGAGADSISSGIDDGLVASGAAARKGPKGPGEDPEGSGRSAAAAAWTQPEEFVEELCGGARLLPGVSPGGLEMPAASGKPEEGEAASAGAGVGAAPTELGWRYADPAAIVRQLVGWSRDKGSSAGEKVVVRPDGRFLQLRTDESRVAALRLATVAVQAASQAAETGFGSRKRSWMPSAVMLCQRALEFSGTGLRTAAASLLAACMLGGKAGRPVEEGVALSRQLGQLDRVADDVVEATLAGLEWLVQGCTSEVGTVALVCGRLLGESASFSPSASEGVASEEETGRTRSRLIDVVQTVLRLAGASGSTSTIADDAKRSGALRALGHVLRGAAARWPAEGCAFVGGESTGPLLPPSLRAACVATLLESTSSSDDSQCEAGCRSLNDVLLNGSLRLERGGADSEPLQKLVEGGDAGLAAGPPDSGWSRTSLVQRLLQLALQRRPPPSGDAAAAGKSKSGKGKNPRYPVAQAAIACLGQLGASDDDEAVVRLTAGALLRLSSRDRDDVREDAGEALANILAACCGAASGTAEPWRLQLACGILDHLLSVTSVSSRNSERAAAIVWVAAAIRACTRPSEAKETKAGKVGVLTDARLVYCHEVMIRGLSERSEAVRSTAAGGLSSVYDSCTDELRKALLPRLTASLGQKTISLPKAAAQSAMSEQAKEELARARAAQEAPPGLPPAPMDSHFAAAAARAQTGMTHAPLLRTDQAYKEVFDLASDTGNPELVYRFIGLAAAGVESHRQSGAATGLAALMQSSAREAVVDHVRDVIPQLFLRMHDPDPRVQDAMQALWRALVRSPPKAIATYLSGILQVTEAKAGSGRVRDRVAAARCIPDILGAASNEHADSLSLSRTLPRLWNLAFLMLMDVQHDILQAAGQAVEALGVASVRLCDPERVGPHAAREALRAFLPFLLGPGLESTVTGVKDVTVRTLEGIVKAARRVLAPFAPSIVSICLEASGAMEDGRLSAAQVHANAGGGAAKINMSPVELELARIRLAKSGPLQSIVERCVQSIAALGAAEAGGMKSIDVTGQSSALGGSGRSSLRQGAAASESGADGAKVGADGEAAAGGGAAPPPPRKVQGVPVPAALVDAVAAALSRGSGVVTRGLAASLAGQLPSSLGDPMVRPHAHRLVSALLARLRSGSPGERRAAASAAASLCRCARHVTVRRYVAALVAVTASDDAGERDAVAFAARRLAAELDADQLSRVSHRLVPLAAVGIHETDPGCQSSWQQAWEVLAPVPGRAIRQHLGGVATTIGELLHSSLRDVRRRAAETWLFALRHTSRSPAWSLVDGATGALVTPWEDPAIKPLSRSSAARGAGLSHEASKELSAAAAEATDRAAARPARPCTVSQLVTKADLGPQLAGSAAPSAIRTVEDLAQGSVLQLAVTGLLQACKGRAWRGKWSIVSALAAVAAHAPPEHLKSLVVDEVAGQNSGREDAGATVDEYESSVGGVRASAPSVADKAVGAVGEGGDANAVGTSKVPALRAVVAALVRESSRTSLDLETAGCALRGMQWLVLSPCARLLGAEELRAMRGAASLILRAVSPSISGTQAGSSSSKVEASGATPPAGAERQLKLGPEARLRLPAAAWAVRCLCDVQEAAAFLAPMASESGEGGGSASDRASSALGALEMTLREWGAALAGAPWEARLGASHTVHVCAAMLHHAGSRGGAGATGGAADGRGEMGAAVVQLLGCYSRFCVSQALADSRFPQLQHAAVWCVARCVGAPAVMAESWRCESGSVGELAVVELRKQSPAAGLGQGAAASADVGGGTGGEEGGESSVLNALRMWSASSDGRLAGMAGALRRLLSA